MGGRLEPLPFERNHALIARHVRSLVDRQGEMALAEQARPTTGGGPRASRSGVETRKGPQLVGRVEIDDEHVDGAVRPRLQLEPPLDLQRRAEQGAERHGLADEATDRFGIAVLG